MDNNLPYLLPSYYSVASDAPTMTAKEMQSELERLARTSKEALDNSQGLVEKPQAAEKSS